MSSFASNAALHAGPAEGVPADYSSLRRENVRISSRGLGLGPAQLRAAREPTRIAHAAAREQPAPDLRRL